MLCFIDLSFQKFIILYIRNHSFVALFLSCGFVTSFLIPYFKFMFIIYLISWGWYLSSFILKNIFLTNLKLSFFCLIKHFDILKFNCYLALSTFDIFHHFLFKPLVNGSNLFLVMCTIYARLLQLCPILTRLNPTDHMVFTTIWTVAGQDPLSMEFFRQEYWSGLLFPSAGDLPNPGSEPVPLSSPALAGGFFTTTAIWEAIFKFIGLWSEKIFGCWNVLILCLCLISLFHMLSERNLEY